MQAERGYSTMDVADVLDRAGVPAEVFYEHFTDKLDCVSAAQDKASGQLRMQMQAAWGSSTAWPQQVAASVGVALRFATDSPQMATLLLPNALLADPELASGAWATIDFLAGALRAGSTSHVGANRPPVEMERVLIAGAQALIEARLRSGRADQLPALKSELIEAILVPYIGIREARAVARAEPETR